MLAKTYDLDKIVYPVEVTTKLDGVAADFYKTPNGWTVQSRQGKPIPSAGHILRYLNYRFKELEVNTHIIGELTVTGVDNFKDAGGVIRRQEEDQRIVLNVFDMYKVGYENLMYRDRVRGINKLLQMCDHAKFITDDNAVWAMVRRVPVHGIANNRTELEDYFHSVEELMNVSPMFEGYMLRCLKGVDSTYKVGKRSRGMMRYKPKPTVDLEVVRFEEATANKDMQFMGKGFSKGEGLRAVGRIVAMYNGEEIGVGPGCLTHVERRDLWDRFARTDQADLTGKGLIAEVEYMLDASYKALRQPVFKQWRPDKTEASEEA